MSEWRDNNFSGGTVTAITMGYEFNLLGSATALKGRTSVFFAKINDNISEKEIKKEKNSWWGNLVTGIIVTVAIAAVAVVVVASAVTLGAGLVLAAPLIGAAIGAGIVTASVAISDKKSGNVRSWNDMAGQLFMGVVLGAAAGATIAGIGTALPAAAQAIGLQASMQFGVSNLTAIVIPKVVQGFGIGLISTHGLFLGNEINSMASGENLLLKSVFGNNQAAYDNTFMLTEMIGMGIVQLGQDNAGLGKTKSKGIKEKTKGFNSKTSSSSQKGNFGEIIADDNIINNDDIRDAGFNLKSIGRDAPESIDDKIVKGIDGLYKNTNTDSDIKYVVDEAKYGKSTLSKTKDGLQMSDDWLKGANTRKSRILEAVNGDIDLADDILDALDNGQVIKVLSVVDDVGNTTTYQLDSKGKIIGEWP